MALAEALVQGLVQVFRDPGGNCGGRGGSDLHCPESLENRCHAIELDRNHDRSQYVTSGPDDHTIGCDDPAFGCDNPAFGPGNPAVGPDDTGQRAAGHIIEQPGPDRVTQSSAGSGSHSHGPNPDIDSNGHTAGAPHIAVDSTDATHVAAPHYGS